MPSLQKVNVERERLRNIALTKATPTAQDKTSALALTKATVERKAQNQGKSVAEYLGQVSIQEIAKNIENYAESAAEVNSITELTLARQKVISSRPNAKLDFGQLLQLKRQKEFQNKNTAQLIAYALAKEDTEMAKVAELALDDNLLQKSKAWLDPQVQIRNSGSWLKISVVSAEELAAQKEEDSAERLANLYIKPVQDSLTSQEFVVAKLKIRQRA
ncbi:MAG: hypothetical protein LBK68_03320 [Candidatus Margulisbacteria bacterium]|jgi:hypothetical protein|nr:hypothetical protein [Candidatus Margulisiibacteriota bacterium]